MSDFKAVVAGERAIALSGEVDMSNADQFRKVLFDYLPESGELVIDLSALGYIDSSALHALIEVAKAAASRDARLVLSAPTHPVRRLFDLVAIDDVPGIVRR